METWIRIGGLYCFAFAVFHLFFWRLFNWGEDLKSLTFLNRQVMQVLNISLIVAFMVFGYLSLAYPGELLTTPLGKALLVSISLFWLARAVQQVIFFRLKRWPSVAFFIVFLLGAALYGVPLEPGNVEHKYYCYGKGLVLVEGNAGGKTEWTDLVYDSRYD